MPRARNREGYKKEKLLSPWGEMKKEEEKDALMDRKEALKEAKEMDEKAKEK